VGPGGQRARSEAGVTVRDETPGGPRAALGVGPDWFPRSVSLFLNSFSFSFFCFLIYFKTFSFVLQFKSNQIVKFSKNQDNTPEQ
jgi:hypothetical protein